MEAPEKIYADPEVFNISDEFNDLLRTKEDGYIEYTRTDAFIEKAWCWIEDNILSSNQQDKSRSYCKQFRNYMKGE